MENKGSFSSSQKFWALMRQIEYKTYAAKQVMQ